MKKLFTVAFILFSFCAKADYWTQKANFPGGGREYPFSFSIGNKGYVGCGKDSLNNCHDDFWEYDPATNIWTQKASFGGGARFIANGFSIGNKGYVGCGLDNTSIETNDFWEYDPAINIWTQKAHFGGAARYAPIGFSIGNLGYMGTGYDNVMTLFDDLWQYNTVTDTWTQKNNLTGLARTDANCFAIGNNGYVIAGGNFSAGTGIILLADLWEYNSISDAWSQKASLPSYPRGDAAAFTICDKGYFGTGDTLGGFLNDFWQYNFVTNTWIQKSNYAGSSTDEAAFFSIASKGYIGLGNDQNPTNNFWEYTPDSACTTGIEETSAPLSMTVTVSPNPAKDYIVINIPGFKKVEYLTITDVEGKIVLEKPLTPEGGPEMKISVEDLMAGVYFVEVNNGKQKGVRRFVKE